MYTRVHDRPPNRPLFSGEKKDWFLQMIGKTVNNKQFEW